MAKPCDTVVRALECGSRYQLLARGDRNLCGLGAVDRCFGVSQELLAVLRVRDFSDPAAHLCDRQLAREPLGIFCAHCGICVAFDGRCDGVLFGTVSFRTLKASPQSPHRRQGLRDEAAQIVPVARFAVIRTG